MKATNFYKILTISIALALILPSFASATTSSFIGFQAELLTKGDTSQFAIRNISDQAQISSIVLELGSGSVFDFSKDWVEAELTVTHFSGTSAYSEWSNSFTSVVGESGYIDYEVNEDKTKAIFSFDGFDSGESWGILLDIADGVRGADLSGSLITASFLNPDGILTYLYGTVTNNGVSFPAEIGAQVPVPPAAWLLGAAMVGIVGFRKKVAV